ncbi:MAG: hypothetical protein JSV52_06230 [Candidatus Zixiibacteriota bacterium]|nr:MAG: hypothetical protein JSV52_06230 [candidate division Zixibacteria bacterium]
MKLKLLVLCLLLSCFSVASAQEGTSPPEDTLLFDSTLLPAPVTNLVAFDTENDHGHAITLEWEISVDDGAGKQSVAMYEVFRWVPDLMTAIPSFRDTLDYLKLRTSSSWSEPEPGSRTDSIHSVFAKLDMAQLEQKKETLERTIGQAIRDLPAAHAAYPENGSWQQVAVAPSGSVTAEDVGTKEKDSPDYLPDYSDFYYRVNAVTADPDIRTPSEIFGPVQSYGQWFNLGRLAVFVFVMIFGFLTIFFVSHARRGADLYVRPLAGIEAVDDAIGRATEMGRPILYVMGLGTADQIATIASFTILGRVAKRVAEYQTKLMVPAYESVVMAVAQEVVKTAYYDAGRPDDYKEDIVFFVTSLQFAYVAAVNGLMLRELPATNVYMGKFFAESLLLAETGAVAGSIQIAGTDEIAQIPFFIVACDYTLIGEELYAASAYLGREPILLGSLKAQDWAKAAVIILVLAGLILANLGVGNDWAWANNIVDFFRVVD